MTDFFKCAHDMALYISFARIGLFGRNLVKTAKGNIYFLYLQCFACENFQKRTV